MLNPETLTWVLTGALFLITCIGGALYKMLREEAKEHSERIEKKANNDRLVEVEIRLQREVASMEANNKDLIKETKLGHQRDLDNLTSRLGDQIRSVESNVIARLQLFVDAVNKPRNNS